MVFCLKVYLKLLFFGFSKWTPNNRSNPIVIMLAPTQAPAKVVARPWTSRFLNARYKTEVPSAERPPPPIIRHSKQSSQSSISFEDSLRGLRTPVAIRIRSTTIFKECTIGLKIYEKYHKARCFCCVEKSFRKYSKSKFRKALLSLATCTTIKW